MMEFAKRTDRWLVGQQVFEVCVSQGQMRTGRGGGHVGDLLFIGGLNVADDAGLFTAGQLALLSSRKTLLLAHYLMNFVCSIFQDQCRRDLPGHQLRGVARLPPLPPELRPRGYHQLVETQHGN